MLLSRYVVRSFLGCLVVAFVISLKVPSQCSYSHLCTHVATCVCGLYVHLVKHICLSLVSVPLLWMAQGLRYWWLKGQDVAGWQCVIASLSNFTSIDPLLVSLRFIFFSFSNCQLSHLVLFLRLLSLLYLPCFLSFVLQVEVYNIFNQVVRGKCHKILILSCVSMLAFNFSSLRNLFQKYRKKMKIKKATQKNLNKVCPWICPMKTSFSLDFRSCICFLTPRKFWDRLDC